MKKKLVFFLLLLLCLPNVVYAKRGCCSYHGGVAGCSSNGRQICRDGTLSPSCTCVSTTNKSGVIKKDIYGCTDKEAFNYNSKATKDNGSCIAKKYGCMDKNAINYDKKANTKNDSCQYEKSSKEVEEIAYEKQYKTTENAEVQEDKIIQAGKNGQKEIAYKIIVDEKGDIISKEKIKEIIKEEPIVEIIETALPYKENLVSKIENFNIDGEEPSNNFLCGLWIIALLIVIIYNGTHKNCNNLLSKIAKQENKIMKYILYFLYILLIFPPFIDCLCCVIDYFKNKRNA